MKIHNSMIDVPVALIFFRRPNLLETTFAMVRKLRPSKLFLIQDGPRDDSPDDREKIAACRQIVDQIDWECEVRKNYAEENLGCGYRVASGLTWAFEYVDRLVILEDDCVPGESFLVFCKEMLERYADDPRVGMISGMNHLDVYEDTPYDYFFSEGGTIWGWATWKRVWDKNDYQMQWMEDEDAIRLLVNKFGTRVLKKGQRLKSLYGNSRLSSWSYQHGINMYLQSGLILVPKVNLTSNVGLVADGANTKVTSIMKIPKGMRSIYFKKTYPLDPPYRHPKYIINDVKYKEKVSRIMHSKHSLHKRVFQNVRCRIERIISRFRST